MLGVPISTAQCGLRRELGLTSIQHLIYKRKLTFSQCLPHLDNETWTKQAYLENELAKGPMLNILDFGDVELPVIFDLQIFLAESVAMPTATQW